MTFDTTPMDRAAVDDLARAFRGELVGRGDAGYDDHRRVWNGSIDRQLDRARPGRRAAGRARPGGRLAEQDPTVLAGRRVVDVMTWWCPAGTMTNSGQPVSWPDG